MKAWRLALYSFLICLPALMIVAAGGWMVVAHVPRLIRHEPSRIGREYREVAEGLSSRPETATYVGPRKRGWQQRGKISGRPWGYVVDGERTTVWQDFGVRTSRAIVIPRVRPFPYAWVFYGGGSVVAAVLFGLTALAVVSFVRLMRERDDFLSATAHDLTTPLFGMRLTIGRDDEEAKRLTERLLLIVGNIKDFLRMGGRRVPSPGVFDVVALCREAYWLFADDYEDSKGGAVSFDCSQLPSSVAEVSADETMTLQILWNLLGNDLKYAAPYGPVKVRFSRAGGVVRVDFEDGGQGMTPRQMRRAFDRYYRARTVLETGKGGFGIGLCTAREFARSMGGELTVRANSPRGCVFTLTLPSPRAYSPS